MKSHASIPALSLLLLLLPLSAGTATSAGDPAAAERQYRVARRLAAEGSAEAAAALKKVVELDPTGPLADDAIVEEALLLNPPLWPEELGRLDETTAHRIIALLTQVTDGPATGDRSAEARYLRALIRLEPLQRYDSTAARFDLISVATAPERSDWVSAARYAGAWLAERLDRADRAEAAYQRVLVDAPESPAALRARVALARLWLRGGSAGRAAALLQRAVAADAPAELGAKASRELSMRMLLLGVSGAAPSPDPQTVLAGTGARGDAGIVPLENRLIVGDTRSGAITTYDRSGAAGDRWSLEELQAITANRSGWIFAAAGDDLYRLRPGEPPLDAGSQGEFAPISAMVADRGGRIWVVDRRGGRVATLDPGAGSPEVIWESGDSRLVAIAWDGRRLVAADVRGRGLLAIDPGGRALPIPVEGLQRPKLVAADDAGRIAVTDDKEDLLRIVGPDGRELSRLDLRQARINRPAALAFGADGALHVFDSATGTWVVFR